MIVVARMRIRETISAYVAHGHDIAHADRAFEENDQTRYKIREDLLEAKSETDTDRRD